VNEEEKQKEIEKGDEANDQSGVSSGRFVRYQFTKEFLKLKTIGAL
jgi:hypothetical protein